MRREKEGKSKTIWLGMSVSVMSMYIYEFVLKQFRKTIS